MKTHIFYAIDTGISYVIDYNYVSVYIIYGYVCTLDIRIIGFIRGPLN